MKVVLRSSFFIKCSTTKNLIFLRSYAIRKWRCIISLASIWLKDADLMQLAFTISVNGTLAVTVDFFLPRFGPVSLQAMPFGVVHAPVSATAISFLLLQACGSGCDFNSILAPRSDQLSLFRWEPRIGRSNSLVFHDCWSPHIRPPVGLGRCTVLEFQIWECRFVDLPAKTSFRHCRSRVCGLRLAIWCRARFFVWRGSSCIAQAFSFCSKYAFPCVALSNSLTRQSKRAFDSCGQAVLRASFTCGG